MPKADSLTVGISGSGRMASALVQALRQNGIPVSWLLANESDKNRSFADRFSIPFFNMESNPPEIPPAELLILAVSDQAIRSVAKKMQPWLEKNPSAVLIHTSGGTSVSVVSDAAPDHRFVGSLHPIQTFTGNEDASFFKGIFCSVVAGGEEADQKKVLETLTLLAQQLGMNPLVVNDETKKKLHTAAVFCSNYMATLVFAAQQIFKDDEVLSTEELPAIMAPLMRTSLENILKSDPEKALTGPVKRGDIETIRRHLDLLQNTGQLEVLYKELGRLTAELAGNKDLMNNV